MIVKPVDSSGGIGISICENENELFKAYSRAVSLSKTNQAIVEEFIEGDEFQAGYTIKDGEISLSFMSDRYLYSEPNKTMPLSQGALTHLNTSRRYVGRT